MSTTIESLELEVQSSATSATSGIDALSASLSRLKNAVKGGVGLTSVANQLRNLNTALQSMDGSSADKIDRLANSLSKLSGLGSIKISASIGNQLRNIGSAVSSLGSTDFSGLSRLSTALAPLNSLSRASGLQSAITQLNKLPQLAQTLNGIDWDTFTQQIQRLSSALTPLVRQLNRISSAFGQLPANIRRLIRDTNRLSDSNNNAANSYVNFWAKCRMAMNAVRGVARTIASWITESNSYIENINLFNASMGQYAAEAQKYAETVGELMGIDPGEWMRNQGVFMTITEGFGVATERAYVMSQQLTQLGYDLSSFFNISFEDAMQKLQSGISGELEPLRRLGYDLSQARLQAVALSLGIDKSFSSMTQAEKAQLRYYAIMTQVTKAQGDMARTLNAPANQLRILQAQVTQCARALGNIFIPALNAVLPYAIALAKVIRLIASEIAAFFGFELPEVDYSGITAGADAVAGSAADTEDGLNGATKAAKKLKNALLGIDELNIISPNDDSGSGGDGSGLGIGGGDLGFELPTYDFLGDIVSTKVDEIVEKIKGALSEITAIISGFLLAIGTILVVTGANVPVGLALMAVGAAGLISAIALNWNYMSERLAKVLTLVTAVLGGFLLAIGAFLAFSGVNVPLGAALMVAGAAALVTAAAINWKFLNGDIANALSILTGIVSGALLAIGALFAFTGVDVPLGIALMAAGAIGLVTAIGLNWDSMSDPMRRAIGLLESIVGGALLTFGAILAFTGANIPLGVGMIAAGAVSLVSAVALNWNALTGDLKGSVQSIVAIVSGALIGIGAILAFTGVATGLGIAMIAAGAVGLAATVGLDWNSMPKEVKSVVTKILTIVGAAAIVIGAILAFTGVGVPLGVGLMLAGAASLGTAVALNWDYLVGEVKKVTTKVLAIAGAAALAIGLILVCTGVGIPLGVGLILAGAASLGTAVAINWDTITEKIGQGLRKIADKFGEFKGWVGEKLEGFKEFGKNVIEGFTQGITEFFSDPLGWIKEHIVDPFVEGFKNLFGIHSPSTVMAAVGGDVAQGLLNGILEPFKAIGKWIKKNILDPIKNAIEKSPVGELVIGIKNNISSLWEKAKGWWADATKDGITVEAAVELVKKGWHTVKGWIGNIPVVSQAVSLLKRGWESVKSWVGNIPTLEQGIELAKKGWKTVTEWIGNIPIVSQAVELAKHGWQSVKEWVGKIPTLSQAISLIKSGWTTVKNWVGHIPTLSQAIQLVKSGWQSVREWIGTIPVLSQAIQLIKSGWTTVKNWVGYIPTLDQAISLIKSGWTTVKNWIGTLPVISQAIQLIKSGWTTVKNWIGNIPVLSQAIQLIKSGWSTVSGWIGNIPTLSQAISLVKSGWSSVKGWIGSIPAIEQAIKLIKSGWSSIAGFVGTSVSVGVSLFKSGWSSLSSWIGNKVSVGIKLFKSGWSSIKSFFGLSSGGYNSGHGWKFFEKGGFIDNGQAQFWKSVPMYKNGTTNAGLHGSMFVAGENGAEMVGHINGQTEVLNRSQISIAMTSAVVAGMSQFVGYWRMMNSQMVTCTNAIIRAVLATPDMTQYAFAGVTSYDPTNALAQSVYEDSQRAYNNGASSDSVTRSMQDFYRDYVEPTLKEIAYETKRQADKEEQTIVQVGDRTITDAVERQQKANGFKFA